MPDGPAEVIDRSADAINGIKRSSVATTFELSGQQWRVSSVALPSTISRALEVKHQQSLTKACDVALAARAESGIPLNVAEGKGRRQAGGLVCFGRRAWAWEDSVDLDNVCAVADGGESCRQAEEHDSLVCASFLLHQASAFVLPRLRCGSVIRIGFHSCGVASLSVWHAIEWRSVDQLAGAVEKLRGRRPGGPGQASIRDSTSPLSTYCRTAWDVPC